MKKIMDNSIFAKGERTLQYHDPKVAQDINTRIFAELIKWFYS